MTYGWAILIVVIVAAVLFSLGVFNPSTFTQTTATGFSGFNVPSGGFQMRADGTLSMQVTNGAGATIAVRNATATIGSTIVTNSSAVNGGSAFGPGTKVTISFPTLGARSLGSAYSVTVKVVYDNVDTGLTSFITSGTLTGTVS